MSINQFLGTATPVAQVDTFTPATIEATDVFTLTVTGFDGTSDSISYTAVDTSATTVSGALIAAWNLEAGSLFTGITASGTATVILTADTAGVAFKVASSAVDGGGADTQTFTRVATTPNGGPSDWQDADNWTLNVPGENGAGEDVFIADSDVDILYGLDNTSPSATVDTIHTDVSYTGLIGWDEDAGFVGDYLQVHATEIFIGENFDDGNAPGSARTKIDAGTVQTAFTIYNTSSQSDTNKPACRLLANNASSIVRDVRKGTVGFSFLDSETGVIGTAFQSYKDSSQKATDSQLSIGRGATITSLEAVGGKTTVKCAATTLTNKGGTMLIIGEGAVATINADGGTTFPASTGLVGLCNVKSGICDFTVSAEPRTVTDLKVKSGATLNINTSIVTPTNEIQAFESGRFSWRVSDV